MRAHSLREHMARVKVERAAQAKAGMHVHYGGWPPKPLRPEGYRDALAEWNQEFAAYRLREKRVVEAFEAEWRVTHSRSVSPQQDPRLAALVPAVTVDPIVARQEEAEKERALEKRLELEKSKWRAEWNLARTKIKAGALTVKAGAGESRRPRLAKTPSPIKSPTPPSSGKRGEAGGKRTRSGGKAGSAADDGAPLRSVAELDAEAQVILKQAEEIEARADAVKRDDSFERPCGGAAGRRGGGAAWRRGGGAAAWWRRAKRSRA